MEFKTSKKLDKWIENHRKQGCVSHATAGEQFVYEFLPIMLVRKENNVMGITAKPVSKMQSIMRKMENQLESERKAAKEKKEAKKSKTNISKQ